MTAPGRDALRIMVLAGGAAVIVASAAACRLSDWPIYAVFVALALVLFVPQVEVWPGVRLGVPEMAVAIGFLYIGGLPIIAINTAAAAIVHFVRDAPPRRWTSRLPALLTVAAPKPADGPPAPSQQLTAWATFSLGLGARWAVVSALATPLQPTAAPWAMLAAEAVGYAVWSALSLIPIYPDRPLVSLMTPNAGLRVALNDIGIIIVLAQTPFVFLMAYGFQAEGLPGAAGWGLSTLGLHVVLKRLHERRLRLEILNRELEHRERLSAIGKMSSVVSHQLLQQLGVIGIHADLIRNADNNGDAADAVARARCNALSIEGALRDVNRVLTDLLVFSKDLRLNLYDHALERVVAECVEECRPAAAERGIVLRVDSPAALPARVDKLKFTQALANVVRNAIAASPTGSEVLVATSLRDSCAEITVSDRGPGVAERDRELIFAPFFTTKDSGTGLGLAIAREFCEAHGGGIRIAAPARAGGATFVIWLPVGGPQG